MIYLGRSNSKTKNFKETQVARRKILVQDVCTWNACFYIFFKVQDAVKTSLELSEKRELNLSSTIGKFVERLLKVLNLEDMTGKLSG